MASDSRSNAGFDQVNVCRKMYRFVQEGERVFVILTSGSLSISQSIMSLLRLDFDAGQGLAQARSMYHAARIVGECVRRVSEIDRASLERDSFTFNVNLLLGGQVRGEEPALYLDLPAGQPAAGDRGFSVPAARRVQVRAADPRSRHRHGHFARGRGQVRAAVVRRHDAIERDRRPADRPADLPEERVQRHPAPPARRDRPGSEPDPRLLGAVAAPRGRAAARDSLRRARSRAARGRRCGVARRSDDDQS